MLIFLNEFKQALFVYKPSIATQNQIMYYWVYVLLLYEIIELLTVNMRLALFVEWVIRTYNITASFNFKTFIIMLFLFTVLSECLITKFLTGFWKSKFNLNKIYILFNY